MLFTLLNDTMLCYHLVAIAGDMEIFTVPNETMLSSLLVKLLLVKKHVYNLLSMKMFYNTSDISPAKRCYLYIACWLGSQKPTMYKMLLPLLLCSIVSDI